MTKTILDMQQVGSEAVGDLRLQKLTSGRPFMINSSELSSDQCYIEFPDGSIKLVSLISSKSDYSVIKKLSLTETNELRRKFHLDLNA